MSSKISDIVDIRYANVFGIYGHLGGGKSMISNLPWLLGRGVFLLARISNFINPWLGNQIITYSGGKT